jgi:hypothetical protein
MAQVHLTLDGEWTECVDPACALKFHIPDMMPEQASALPRTAMLNLLEAIDPPEVDHGTGTKQWLTEIHQLHREYDLPAAIEPDGSMAWWSYGKRHRGNDRPALITPTRQEWWLNGERHRDSGKPAVIHQGGRSEYWSHGMIVGWTG